MWPRHFGYSARRRSEHVQDVRPGEPVSRRHWNALVWGMRAPLDGQVFQRAGRLFPFATHRKGRVRCTPTGPWCDTRGPPRWSSHPARLDARTSRYCRLCPLWMDKQPSVRLKGRPQSGPPAPPWRRLYFRRQRRPLLEPDDNPKWSGTVQPAPPVWVATAQQLALRRRQREVKTLT